MALARGQTARISRRPGPWLRTPRAALVGQKRAESFRCDPQPAACRDQVDVRERAIRRARAPALLEPSGVDGERAAAALRRRDDLVAVGREDTRRRGVHVAEDGARDAAREEPDRGPRVPGQLSRRAVAAPRHGGAMSRSGEGAPAPARAAQRKRERSAHAAGVGKNAEDHRAQQALASRAIDLLLHLGPGELDQPVVLDAGRAGGDAGHAAEAAVEVL